MTLTKMCANISWMIALLSLGYVLSEAQYDNKLENVTIGGIFYNDSTLINIFNLIEFEDVKSKTARLNPVVRVVNYGDILAAGNHVCELAEMGVYAVVDGTEGRTSAHIQAVCDSLEIPHIITHHNYLQAKNWSVVNLFPSAVTYNRILAELIHKKEWQNFTIMYVKGHSISSARTMLELHNKDDVYAITVRELSGDNYRAVFAAAKKMGNVNFLVDCPGNKIIQILSQAQEVGLMSNKHSYIFTSPDLHSFNLDQFKYGGANITGFRLLDPKDGHVMNVSVNASIEGTMSTELALVYDAALICARAYEKLPIQPITLYCNKSLTWMHGSSVVNVMRTNSVRGLTRGLQFDSEGYRNNFTFDVFELTRAGIMNVAVWNDGLKIEREYIKVLSDDKGIMMNKTFKVLITLTPPFGFVKETIDGLSGNDRYEGFSIDMIDELSQKLGFLYIFEVATSAGEYKNKKSATGMVKTIMEKEADFGICDFTITRERQSALDFTTPFMSVGIAILYKKPSKQPPAMFSFMEVFSVEVWINMLLAQMGLALVMIFVGRISHKEWHNPIPCIEDPQTLDNQFSIANALWLIIGSVMQQGSEVAPISLGTRTITSVWWFFTMVMISSYTGTLVAFLTVEGKTLPFKTAEELGKQTYIEYGAKHGGSTLQFFNQSTNPIYKAMFEEMTVKHDWCPTENTIGRERVQAGGYAFFMESAAIEYELERNCELMQVGDTLDTKNYGIGMHKNSPYNEAMSNAILKMKESGTLQKIKDKWWKERRGGGSCAEDDDGGEPKQLEMKNMVGAFVVLGGGCLLGIIISILAMLWGVYKRTIKYNTSYRDELMEELRFALKFSGDTKPVRKRPQAPAEGPPAEAQEKAEFRDELLSLHSVAGSGSTDTRHTRHSHCTNRSSRSQSLAFARRRRYS